MKKVKTFFHVFVNSLLPQANYYKKILKTHFDFSLRYFIGLIIILNVLFVINIYSRYSYPTIGRLTDSAIKGLKNIPEDLQIYLNKGLFFTSYSRPYFFWIDDQKSIKLLFVIDETAYPQKINTYGASAMITSKEVVIGINKKEPITLPLNDYWPVKMIIDHQEITKITDSLVQFRQWLTVIYTALFLVLLIAIPLISLLTIGCYLIAACLVIYFVFSMFIRKKIHFKKVVQISFHSFTLPLILDYATIIFQPFNWLGNFTQFTVKPSFLLPFLFFLMIIVFVFAGAYEAYLDQD